RAPNGRHFPVIGIGGRSGLRLQQMAATYGCKITPKTDAPPLNHRRNRAFLGPSCPSPKESGVSRRLRSSCLTFAVFILSATYSIQAFAHAILESSQPGNGATIAGGDVSFQLTYNSRIDPTRSIITLTLPDQSKTKLAIAAGTAPNILASTQHLAAGS